MGVLEDLRAMRGKLEARRAELLGDIQKLDARRADMMVEFNEIQDALGVRAPEPKPRASAQKGDKRVARAVPIGPKEPGPIALRQWVAAENVTFREMAATLGISANALAVWARGDSFPTLRYAEQLATLTGIPVSIWGH